MADQFCVGDLVWAKADRHPWWPGLIYHESLTSPEARQAKKKGCVLVSFFGDYSYKWLNPKKLIPFESNYSVYSNRSSSRLFMKAINEAVYEVIHRAAIGMTCPCEYFASYRPSREGLLEVEIWLDIKVEGFIQCSRSNNSDKNLDQLKHFHLFSNWHWIRSKIFHLFSNWFWIRSKIFHLFSNWFWIQPMCLKIIYSSKEVARVLAFRKAMYAEVDEPYFLAFGVTPPIRPSRDPIVSSNNQEISLFQDPHETEFPCQKKPKVKRQNKTERPLARLNDKVDADKAKSRVKRYGRRDSNTTSSVEKMLEFTSASEDKIQRSPSPFKEPSVSNGDSDLQQEETTVTPPHDPVTSCSAFVCRIQRLSDEIHTRYWQQKGESRVKVNQGSVDISEKMLYLLNKCSRIVLESKGF